jgi:microcystin-dependent protein
MSDQFVGEIRIGAWNFAPVGWAFCSGQLMAISQNTALFSLLGTNYGGNGTSTFGLPNLQGAVPLHAGGSGGPGLTQRLVGETGGEPTVTLLQTQLPAHNHSVQAHSTGGDLDSPTAANALWAAAHSGKTPIKVYNDTANGTTMNPATIASAGGSQPHNNLPPYLCLTFVIALSGIFPPRS